MVVHRRKKLVKQRGTRTHGWGTKKHRGSGNRGGFGMAGTGKRADQKKPSVYAEYGPSYFGKTGFTIPPKIKKSIKAINIKEANKLAAKDNVLNLTELGYDKLLGKGNLERKLKIIVKSASANAIEKIKKIGGEVITEVNSE